MYCSPVVRRLAVGIMLVSAACDDTVDPMAPDGLDPRFGRGASSAATTTYSGQATVVSAHVTTPLVNVNSTVSDTGPVPASGGALETSLLTVSVPDLLTARVAHAATVANAGASRAEASVADVALSVAGNSIGASLLMARASAVCSYGRASVNGESHIAQLTINGQSITVTGAPNQTISLPVGKVVINEQTASKNGITVNALHVVIPGLADVVISSAHADITCVKQEPCPPAIGDFVTGGGYISVNGGKANFGAAGGIKNQGLWGHLTYHDHPANLMVKETSITGYEVTGPTSRRITGTANANGSPVTYTLDVSDNGEPGTSDTFTLSLSNGYSAGGTLAGGNLQLHKKSSSCQ